MNIKNILTSTVLAAGILSASTGAYEVGLSYGLDSIDKANFEHHSLQATISSSDYAIWDNQIVPRVDFEYVSVDDNSFPLVDNLYRLSLNGIYDLSNVNLISEYTKSVKPYVLGGAGYELVDEEQPANGFSDRAFVQFGLGAKYAVSDKVSVKFEAKGMSTFGEGSEYQLYVGAIMPFGGVQSAVVTPKVQKVKQIAIIDTIDDVVDTTIDKPKVVVSVDSDNDGVQDSVDSCPNTPASYVSKVNSNGCVGKATLKVHFGPNSYKIQSQYRDEVNEFADYLQAFPKYNAKIVGYVSTDHPSAVGKKLTRDRANMVKKALVVLGVDSSRLSTSSGYKAVASNASESGRQNNRRVEVTVFVP